MANEDEIDKILQDLYDKSNSVPFDQANHLGIQYQTEGIEYQIQILQEEGLIEENMKVKTFSSMHLVLLPFGRRVVESGGYKQYKDRERAKAKLDQERETLEIRHLQSQIGLNEWMIKYKTLPYWLSAIALIISILQFFEDEIKKLF